MKKNLQYLISMVNQDNSSSVSSVVQMSFSGLFGGRERVAYALAKLLEEVIPNSLLYLVVEERAGIASYDELLINLNKYGLKYRIFFVRSRFSFRVLNEIATALVADNVQIVHCHCYKSAAFSLVARFFYRLENKITITLHGLRLPLSFSSFHILLSNYISLYFVDGIIGCSREVIANYLGTARLNKKISFIPNGVMPNVSAASNSKTEIDSRELFSSQFSIEKEAVWIGYVGRLTQEKNVKFLLESIARMHALGLLMQPTVFIIAGEGELKEELQSLARRLGINDRVCFTGFLSDIDALYAALDIQVLTSDIEGTPMCILEGMAHKLPVVASAVGGVVDLVEHGRSGMLFDKGDMEAFCSHLAELIGDAEKRVAIGQCAFEKSEKDFSANAWRQKQIDHYAWLLQPERIRPL